MSSEPAINVAKADLVAAWAVLENLAVSLDQIGSVYALTDDNANWTERECELQQALASYLTPKLVKAINKARMRLVQYLSNEESEALADKIKYWDYAGLRRPKVAR